MFCQFICIEIYLLNLKRIIMATNGILQLLELLFLFAACVLLTGVTMHSETGCIITQRRFMAWRKWAMLYAILHGMHCRVPNFQLGGFRERLHNSRDRHVLSAGSHADRCLIHHYPFFREQPSDSLLLARGLRAFPLSRDNSRASDSDPHRQMLPVTESLLRLGKIQIDLIFRSPCKRFPLALHYLWIR
jgi:hypothetical protein